jgi:hypothetical protein
MTTKLEAELKMLGRGYPELAARLREFLGNGQEVSSADYKTPLDTRKQIFEHWARVFQKKRVRFKAGSKRDAKVVARLKSFTQEEIIKALDGFAMDPWRHEELVRHELATLLRNDEQVEAGLDIFDNGGRNVRTSGYSGPSQNGSANSTISYGREASPRVPGLQDSTGATVQDDSARWNSLRWGRPDIEEDNPFG